MAGSISWNTNSALPQSTPAQVTTVGSVGTPGTASGWEFSIRTQGVFNGVELNAVDEVDDVFMSRPEEFPPVGSTRNADVLDVPAGQENSSQHGFAFGDLAAPMGRVDQGSSKGMIPLNAHAAQSNEPKAIIERVFKSLREPTPLLPLLNIVPGLNFPETQQTQRLDSSARGSLLCSLVARLLFKIGRVINLSLIILNSQWMDRSSWNIVERIIKLRAKVSKAGGIKSSDFLILAIFHLILFCLVFVLHRCFYPFSLGQTQT
jgi:hypothetical protein